MNEIKDLIGLHINRAMYNGTNIFLDTDQGIVMLEPYGQCCAYCFIQHVSIAYALINSDIISVKDITFFQPIDALFSNQTIEVWGHSIDTTKGSCTIEMRVEHNGYYGGSLNVSFVEKIPQDSKPLEDF